MTPIIIAIVLAVGVTLSGCGLVLFVRSKRTEAWREFPLDCIDVDLSTSVQHDMYMKLYNYLPDVRYTYTTEGVSHKSSNVYLDEKAVLFDNIQNAERMCDQLKTLVVVYVNPKDFREAVLLTGTSRKRRSHYYSLIASGLIISLAGFGLITII